MEALVSTNGEIVIPAALRDKLGINPGDFVHIPDQAIQKKKPSLLGCARTGKATPPDIDKPLDELWEAQT
jgi:AbrB family looped-hinge helix DNA binding protein